MKNHGTDHWSPYAERLEDTVPARLHISFTWKRVLQQMLVHSPMRPVIEVGTRSQRKAEGTKGMRSRSIYVHSGGMLCLEVKQAAGLQPHGEGLFLEKVGNRNES